MNEPLTIHHSFFFSQAKDSQLALVFTGVLNNKMKGFYRSTYKTASGEEKRVACTQFEVWHFFDSRLSVAFRFLESTC